MTTAAVPPPETRKTVSRRRERIRLVVRWSAILAIFGVGMWALLKYLNKEREYRPGEEVEGITRELERQEAPASKATAARKGLVFSDVTKEAGLGDFRTFEGQRTSQLPEDMGGGVAWADFDNDGDDDLFLTSAGGPLTATEARLAPSGLYENTGGGKFKPSHGFGDMRIRGMGAAWADFDNDGWLDLAVTGYDFIGLFRNRQGRFERVASFRSLPGFWTGVSWGDFNRDGWPDLYVCGYVQYKFSAEDSGKSSQQFGQAVPHTLNPSSYEPERNLLFQNDGRGGFREVAQQLGVDNPTGRSLSALWHDFDDNGWQDLYVANDISESKLYLNFGGRFEDAGRTAWVGEYRGSMGLAAGDFDRDGDDDLFISHWVAQQFALYESLLADQALLGEKGSGAKPELHFTDVAEMKGIGQPTLRSIGWGAEFADFDSDGWLDLAVAAGSTFESETIPKRLLGMPSFLFANRKGKEFQLVRDPALPLAQARVSRGLAVSDFDLDGDLDLATVDLDGGVRLLRNDSNQGKTLHLRLRGANGRVWSGADGAQVASWTDRALSRRTLASASYLSQSSREVHIGLGDAVQADRVTVRWPDGDRQEVGPLAAGVIWQLKQGQLPEAVGGTVEAREREIAFWDRHRAGMDRLKRDRDPIGAVQLFKQALALNPGHEDARYYLASCLTAAGDTKGAISELQALLGVNPSSHRAMLRMAYLHAANATTKVGLTEAAREASRAHALNPEETGALQLLAEIELLRGNQTAARDLLRRVVQTNHKAALAHFLLAYLDSRDDRKESMRTSLEAAVKARGPEWKPKGSVHEGDVQRRMHEDSSLLLDIAESWDGQSDPHSAFASLNRRIRSR